VSPFWARAVRLKESRADCAAEKLGSFEILGMKERSGMSSLAEAWFWRGADRRFGEQAMKKMRRWAHQNLPPTSPNSERTRIMECGTGNGTLLLSFLTSPSSSSEQRYHLTGTDYSPGSITLAQEVEASQRQALAEGDYDDDEEIINDVTTDWRVVDLLRHDFEGEEWDLVLDKGTFDALCLSEEMVDGKLPSQVYPERIAKVVKEGGFFLITSCNFTEEEIKARWGKEELGLEFQYVPSSFPSETS
jgi:SAM-dependent methyltransferase